MNDKPNQWSELDDKCVETIRFLSMEAVQNANSGHPGMPMGMAAATYELWMNHLRHNPADPKWINRDRFVLSAGHGSALLYSMLHLTGYDLSLEEVKSFRQWNSLTPGHPEYGHTPGVEVTTGPLGQGIATLSVWRLLRNTLPQGTTKMVSISSIIISMRFRRDGCLQEGVSGEASSLAGHLGLDNMIVIYDDNHITIDGKTELSFSEDVVKRYEAYGWYVQVVDGDGTNIAGLREAIENAKAQTGKPSIIKFRSYIGYGSPKFENSSSAHGSPIGDDEIRIIKEKYGWDPEKSFVVPEEVAAKMQGTIAKGTELQTKTNDLLVDYAGMYPELAAEIEGIAAGKPAVVDDDLMPAFEAGTGVATRKASGMTLNALMGSQPLVLGGSADLTPSNNTWFDGAENFSKDNPAGRYVRYGVREHAMGAIMNGIAVSGLRPYGGTFLVFADYVRPAVRVAALSGYPTIFVFTHDSIGVGEDGPTHQPVETIASLRAIPNLIDFRPADANETAQAWKYMLENNDGPAAICLTRQNLPVIDQEKYAGAENVAKGAYALVDCDDPDVLLIATGSEVSLAVEAAETLAGEGVKAKVVSMPSWELFERQDKAYQDEVLPPSVKARVGIEAGVEQGWYKWIGTDGEFVGMHSFGASAPAATLFKEFGITAEAVVAAAKKSIG